MGVNAFISKTGTHLKRDKKEMPVIRIAHISLVVWDNRGKLEQAHLLAFWGDLFRGEDRHLGWNLIPGSQFLENLIEFAPVRGTALVALAKLADIFWFNPRKAFVELIVIPIARTAPQRHAKGRQNISCAVLMRQFHQVDDIFLGIFDEGQDRHHRGPRLDAVFGEDSHRR